MADHIRYVLLSEDGSLCIYILNINDDNRTVENNTFIIDYAAAMIANKVTIQVTSKSGMLKISSLPAFCMELVMLVYEPQ